MGDVMGCIISLNGALERLQFASPKKGVVHKAECLVMLDKRYDTGPDVALIKLASGEWTVLGSRHTPNGNWAVMGYGLEGFDKCVLSALVKSGAISATDMREHMDAVARADEKRGRDQAVKDLQSACQRLGISVPEVPEPLT
jgi:hypothetical protein